MQESLLSMNNFGEPKILSNGNAYAISIIRLLMMDKGSIELHPEMGIGLVKNYRYSFTDNLENLRTEIETQVSNYITKIPVTVELYEDSKILYISITIENKKYIFNFNTENNSIKLSDL